MIGLKMYFVTGPGFQIAQIFIENVFEKHIDWLELINTDNNFKNLLQVILQQNFKITPIYKEISEWDEDTGYHMGVYLSINKKHHEFTHNDSCVYNLEQFNKQFHNTKSNAMSQLEKIKSCYNDIILNEENNINSLVIFLSESKHKIKKKAEQSACKQAYEILNH